jgi:hypothetical protein
MPLVYTLRSASEHRTRVASLSARHPSDVQSRTKWSGSFFSVGLKPLRRMFRYPCPRG